MSCRGGCYGYLDIVQYLLKEDADMRLIIPVLADWKKGLDAYWENGAVLSFMVLRVFA